MRRGYKFLTISFVASIITSLASKMGALYLDKILFIFISYSLGTLLIFFSSKQKVNKNIKIKSRKLGILIGIINFFAFYTLLIALSTGPGSLVFPLVGLNLALIVFFSIVLFKEKLNKYGILGFILALISIWLLK